MAPRRRTNATPHDASEATGPGAPPAAPGAAAADGQATSAAAGEAPADGKAERPAGPKPTMVLMVRHGKTPTTGTKLPGRARGLHLSPEGHKQAAEAAKRVMRLKDVAAVYASPLERTRETAAPIAAALGLRTKLEPGLLECDFGRWTGADLKDLFKLPEWRTVQQYPSGFRFPEGESFAEMQLRIVSTIERLCARHPGRTVVAVSHADPIKAALAHALGTHLDLFQRIVVSPCSVSAVLYGATGPVVLASNSTGRDLRALQPS
jgi:probable phosphomutase (TIGR03848 family)